jgi:diguanylate cyclase (GGDEF)-like protein/PAS domain S-box-containing protein
MDGAKLEEISSQGYDYEIWRINPDDGKRQTIISSYLKGKSNMPFIEKQLIIKNAEWNYRVYFRRSWYEYIETWLFVIMTLCVSFLFAVVIEKKSKDIFEAEERIKLMLDTSPLSCQIMNTNFNTIDCNEAAVKLYGYASKQECIIKWDKECLPEYQPNGQLTREYIWDLFLKAIEENNNTFEIMHQSPDGVPMPAEITLVKVNFKGEDVIIGYTKDLRDIKNLEKKAKEIYYDSLTRIYNRRYFDENLEQIIKSSSRSCDILTLMILDIDFFKKYNDAYGHSEGDNCLKTIAAALSGVISREGDFVARYGGEEFVTVLPHTDEIGARAVADKLLESIRKLHILHEKSDVANFVTISIGVTTLNLQHKLNAVDCIKIADKALYMSKQNGRNKYTFIKFEYA